MGQVERTDRYQTSVVAFSVGSEGDILAQISRVQLGRLSRSASYSLYIGWNFAASAALSPKSTQPTFSALCCRTSERRRSALPLIF